MMSSMPPGGHAAFAFSSGHSSQWCVADARVQELRAFAFDIEDAYLELQKSRRASDKYAETQRGFEFASINKLLRQYQGSGVTIIFEDLDNVHYFPVELSSATGKQLARVVIDDNIFEAMGNEETQVLAQVSLNVLQYLTSHDPNRSSDQ